MSEAEILGWKPPLIYDVAVDRHRIATQEDIDRMQAAIDVLQSFYTTVKREVEVVKTAHERYRG